MSEIRTPYINAAINSLECKQSIKDAAAKELKELKTTISKQMEEIAKLKQANDANASDSGLHLQRVINWVAITDSERPKYCTEVLVKFENGETECRFFDGDGRFYETTNDIDITDVITHWAAFN